MKKSLKVTSLSAYTVARNCTDLDDCKVGISELFEWKLLREKNNLAIPQIWYNKMANLSKKEKKFKNKKK